MLVMLSGNLWCDVDLVCWVQGLIRLQAVSIDDTGGFDFELDRSVKGEVKVESVFVVGNCTDGRNDQLSITRDVDSHISEISVLV
jgi:homoaconitase/3-isopropylmalate dehydratase large subunit